MLFGLAFNLFLNGVVLYTFRFGGRPERIGAIAMWGATYLSVPSSHYYAGPEFGILVVDSALLAVLLFLLIKSDRYWPIWATGFHLIAVLTHFAKAIDPMILPVAYANYLVLWSYPVLATLLVATRSMQLFRKDQANRIF